MVPPAIARNAQHRNILVHVWGGTCVPVASGRTSRT
jgi:hypothetical protein